MNINHVLIQTSDLPNMARFIENVTNLKAGNRPPFPFPGIWMYNKDKAVIHIVEAYTNSAQSDYLGSRALTSEESASVGAVDHVAFEGDDYSGLIERLSRNKIDYTERTVPLSQEHQVFIDGPDGVKLEILFNQNKAPLNFS